MEQKINKIEILDLLEAEELKEHLQKIMRIIVKDWSEKRRDSKVSKNSERSGVNIEEWTSKTPKDIAPKLNKVIEVLSNKPEINDEDFSDVVKKLHDLVPEHTYYHYRFLHSEIQSVATEYYIQADFYTAFQEAVKRFKNATRDKSKVPDNGDLDIVSKSYGCHGSLRTTAKFKNRPNGQPFSKTTLNNIEEGQQALSRGIVQGGRNVVSHEEKRDLEESGLFTEKDCLDLLSLLSHLFKRLDESDKRH